MIRPLRQKNARFLAWLAAHLRFWDLNATVAAATTTAAVSQGCRPAAVAMLDLKAGRSAVRSRAPPMGWWRLFSR